MQIRYTPLEEQELREQLTARKVTAWEGVLQKIPLFSGWSSLRSRFCATFSPVVGNPNPGDEVFVSAAAGSVGMLVGQLVKIKGCLVVGSAGSDWKVKLLKEEFGFDDAFNYKSEKDWDAALTRYFPKGIDIYFDNVGGRMLEAVLNHINMKARIPVCGMISQYNQDWQQRFGVRNLLNLVGKCAKMEGFLCGNYLNRMGQFLEEMAGYIKEGKIKYKEDVKEGLDSFLEAFNSMFTGDNIGKPVIHLGPPQ